jgi:hypothetical protein
VARYQFELVGVGSSEGPADYAVFHGLPASNYTWSVRAWDEAGNASDWATFSCSFAQGDDQDGDGLPDAWEIASFGRIDYSDGTRDSDGDGLLDSEAAEADVPGFRFFVTLQQGWNMLALPCDTTVDSISPLFASVRGPVWTWNAQAQRYETPDFLSARQGAWIFSTETIENIVLTGTPPYDDELPVTRGWNLVGAGLPAVFADARDITSILTWTNSAYETFAPTDFQFSYVQGYWMYATTSGQRQLIPLAQP